MQFNFEIDIEGIVAAAVAPERIQPLLDKAITEALKASIEEATGYRSELRKTVTQQLTAALPHGLAVDDVAKFQHLLNTAMTTAIHGANADAIKAAMDKVVGSVMPNVPTSVKLSELLDDARHGLLKDEHESFYARLKPSSYGGGGWLYLDRDERCRSEYSASTHISFNEHGDVYAMKLDGTQVMPGRMPSAVGKFEGLLLSMYVGRTRLVVDLDADDVEDAARAKEDY